MRNVLLLSCFVFNVCYSQIDFENMQEKEFFERLQAFQSSTFTKKAFKDVLKSDVEIASLLKRLEEYLVVIGGSCIAPIYLKDSAHHRSSPIFVSQYLEEKKKFKNNNDAREAVQKANTICIDDLIIELCDLNKINNVNVEFYLSEFVHPFSLEHLYFSLQKKYFDKNEKSDLFDLPQLVKEQNLQILEKRIDIVAKKEYVHYVNYHGKPEAIKGFEMQHDNDVLLCNGLNQDRELTGAFKFTIITDYLKWRWFRFASIKNFTKNCEWIHNKIKDEDNVLSYQTFSLAGVGYTPYIRYRNNFDLADTLYQNDRPFSSSVVIERAKHRTWRNGLIRHRGEFQIGAIGLAAGRKIQAQLHEDLITESQFVHGWENQIANGGRFVLQLNHKADVLLWSNSNRYSTIFRHKSFSVHPPKKKYGSKDTRYGGMNFIGEFDVKAGTIMTTLGFGLRFSTLNLLQQSGNNMIATKRNGKDEFGWKIDFGVAYRHVVHNSYLEGLGFTKPFNEDLYDVAPIDAYVLNSDEINRNLISFDFGVNFKFRKTTVFYRHFYHMIEYKSRLNDFDFQNPSIIALIDPADMDYYNNTVVQENRDFLNKRLFDVQFYGFGTIGISWFID